MHPWVALSRYELNLLFFYGFRIRGERREKGCQVVCSPPKFSDSLQLDSANVVSGIWI